VYSIDEVDNGTPTKALKMKLERFADVSSHMGIGQDCLVGLVAYPNLPYLVSNA